MLKILQARLKQYANQEFSDVWTRFRKGRGIRDPNPRIEPRLLNCKQILYQMSHKGSPKLLDWIAYPFSSRSSPHRNLTRVSCIAGISCNNWAIREALELSEKPWQQTEWKPQSLIKMITWTTVLSKSMKLWAIFCRATPRKTCHCGEFWRNVVHWRRESQINSVFLPWQHHEQDEKAKR